MPSSPTLVEQQIARIANRQELEPIAGAARNVDSAFHAAAKGAFTGHQYLDVVVKGMAETGDTFSSDWKRGTPGPSPVYNGAEVDKAGKALIGNQYSGKGFWED